MLGISLVSLRQAGTPTRCQSQIWPSRTHQPIYVVQYDLPQRKSITSPCSRYPMSPRTTRTNRRISGRLYRCGKPPCVWARPKRARMGVRTFLVDVANANVWYAGELRRWARACSNPDAEAFCATWVIDRALSSRDNPARSEPGEHMFDSWRMPCHVWGISC